MENPKNGFRQLSSGFWERLADGSSPYLFDGQEMIFLTTNGGGGESVDVMNTVISGFDSEASSTAITGSETLIQALSQLQAQLNQINTNIFSINQAIIQVSNRVTALENAE